MNPFSRPLGVNVGGAEVIDRRGPALHVIRSAQALRIAAEFLASTISNCLLSSDD
ncbi:hypothetical protein MY8738_002977 [Beauveria namnaoensis]